MSYLIVLDGLINKPLQSTITNPFWRKQMLLKPFWTLNHSTMSGPPPPPAPPPPSSEQLGLGKNDDEEGQAPPGVSVLSVINSDELLNAKLNLRGAQKKPGVHLGRKILFDDFLVTTHYPIEKVDFLFDQFNKIESLDFTGIDQLTDLVIHRLYDKYNSSIAVKQITKVNLNGCFHITDQGVYWITQFFPNLGTILLRSCKKITERSIYYLEKYCKKLYSVTATGTDIGILDLKYTHDSAGFRVLVDANPIVRPPMKEEYYTRGESTLSRFKYFKDHADDDPYREYKVVIVNPDSIDTNVTDLLTTGQLKGGTKKQLLITQGFKTNGATFNVFECSEVLVDLFISHRTVYFIPYNAVTDQVRTVFSRIATLLSKVPNAKIFVVGINNSNKKPLFMPEQMRDSLKGNAKDTKTELQSTNKQWSSTLGDTKPNHLEQDIQLRSIMLEEILSRFIAEELDIEIVDASAKKEPIIGKLLNSAETEINKEYPYYQKLSPEFIKLAELFNGKGSAQSITEASEELYKHDNGGLSDYLMTYRKFLDYMHMMGKAVVVKKDNSDKTKGYVIKDMEKLVSEMDKVMGEGELNDGSVKCVTRDTTVINLKKNKLDPHIEAIIQKLNLAFKAKDKLIFMNNVKTETPIPLNHYWTPEPIDEITYDFKFHFEPTHNFMHQLFSLVSNYRVPEVLSQDNLLLQPTVCIVWFTVRHTEDYWVLGMHGHIPTFQSVHTDYLWNTLEHYKVYIDFLCQQFGLFYMLTYKYQCQTVDGIPETVAKYVGSAGHTFKDCTECTVCGDELDKVATICSINKSLRPAFTTESAFGRRKGISQKGSIVTILPKTDLDMAFKNICSPGQFSYCEFGLLNGQSLNFGWSFQEGKSKDDQIETAIMFDTDKQCVVSIQKPLEKEPKVPKRGVNTIGSMASTTVTLGSEVEENSKQEEEQQQILKEGIEIGMGDIIRYEYNNVDDSPNDYELVLKINGSPVFNHTVSYATRCRLRNYKHNERQTVLSVDVSNMVKSASTFEVGMRLEALDRLTPNLICVATIVEVHDDGRIGIHFDGWTARYDYVAEPDSADLHPIGWFAQRGHNHSQYTQQLQKPHNYHRRTFDWDTYLIEQDSPPVPFDLFTQDQTEGIDEYQLTAEAQSKISSGAACTKGGRNTSVLKKNTLRNVDKMLETYDQVFSQNTPLLGALPKLLDVDSLRYPSLAKIGAMELYLLCPVKANPHFLSVGRHTVLDDVETVNLSPQYVNVISAKILSLKECLPLDTSSLFPTLLGLTRAEIIYGIKRLLFYSFFITPWDPNDLKLKNGEVNQELQRIYDSALKANGEQFTGTQSGQNNHYLCTSHHVANSVDLGLTSVPEECFTYAHLLTELNFTDNKISALPDDFFISFPLLESLIINRNSLAMIPFGIGKCKNLTQLHFEGNQISALPSDFKDCKETLKSLGISNNPLNGIPEEVLLCTHLQELYAENIFLQEISKDINKLKRLHTLQLGGCFIDEVPETLADLVKLEILGLSGAPFVPVESKKTILSFQALHNFMETRNLQAAFDKYSQKPGYSSLKQLFDELDAESKGVLDYKQINALNGKLFEMFPRLRQKEGDLAEYGGCPKEIFTLTTLEELDLSYQGLATLPETFIKLTNLAYLKVQYNLYMETLNPELGGLSNLKDIQLTGCVSMKTPPQEIISRGHNAVMGFLKRLRSGSSECKRTKLMLVGLGGAGKTSIVKYLTQKSSRNHYYDYYSEEGITDGIDICNWSVETDSGKVTYGVWDFAGQVLYYNTHQFFLSNRAVYILAWNIRLGYEHAGLEFWLSSISVHAPKAPILVVGTHIDQVERFYIPKEELSRKFPQIKGFHEVSALKSQGMKELKNHIIEITLQQEYMGEKIPDVWLKLEQKLIKRKSKEKSLLDFSEVEDCAFEVGIIDPVEVTQAVDFLHDLGAVQHFKNEFLRGRLVIDPQWIVDAMACVVSVHHTPIQEGKLKYSDLAGIWPHYDPSLHKWLLRLTEEFDLTFPVPEEDANIVACLLPENQPEIDWPEVNKDSQMRESKMLYEFDYLPVGLFNRAQVRLYQFSDASSIWKKGSLMKKNSHIALMTCLRGDKLLVKVQGPRPENILFLIHEVFESLISESFNGVTYDFHVPCSDCLKTVTLDPSMLPASRIRRATELKAPFLQCDKFFHTLSLAELQNILPPASNEDYDSHLQRTLGEMKNLKNELSYDVFMLYYAADNPEGKDDELVTPSKIYKDLRKLGFKVWFAQEPTKVDIEKVAVTMREAQLILICISDDFANDEHSNNLYNFAKNILQKMCQFVVVGKGMSWTKSTIGLQIASEVYVKMDSVPRYPIKIVELKDTITQKIGTVAQKSGKVYPKCFISYCWTNSHDAIKKGSRAQDGSLGWADPRALKEFLEEKGISVWMDVEQVGQGALFDSIAEGLKKAKVCVVCVSDEYAKSRNCQIEFRFANIALKIPIVVAVVGTGQTWEATEVGMLSLGHPKIGFQYESPTAHDRLLEAVKAAIPPEDENEAQEQELPPDNNEQAFQELVELSQRKFLRQLAGYSDNLGEPYPRIILLDLIGPEEKKLIQDKWDHYNSLAEKREKFLKEQEDKYDKAKEEKEKGQGDENPEVKLESSKEDSKPAEKEEDSPERPSSSRPVSARQTRKTSALRRMFSTFNAEEKKHGFDEDTVAEARPKFAVEEYEFCMRILCEHESGWHVEGLGFILDPMSVAETEAFMTSLAPYMARALALLEHAGFDLRILNTEKGTQIRNTLQEKCGVASHFKEEYNLLRERIISMDEERSYSGLSRCYLPSGKMIWLCKTHQKGDRITVLSNKTNHIQRPTETQDDFLIDKSSIIPNGSNAEATKVEAAAEKNTELATKPQEEKPKPKEEKPKPKERVPFQKRTSKLKAGASEGEKRKLKEAASVSSGNIAKESKACVLM